MCQGTSREKIEVKGLFWLFLIMVTLSSNSCQTIFQYCSVLVLKDNALNIDNKSPDQVLLEQNEYDESRTKLFYVLYQIIGELTFQFIYYCVNQAQIRVFIKSIHLQIQQFEEQQKKFQLREEEKEQQQQIQKQPRSQQQQQQKDRNLANQIQQLPDKKKHVAYKSKIILEEKEVIPSMNIPEFVSRISSTYFKLLTGGTEYQIEMNYKVKKLEEKKKQELLKQKLKVNHLKNKSSKRSSIKSINKSGITAATLNTQTFINTQGDIIQTTRGNKIEAEQNDFEDVLIESRTQQKTDIRSENSSRKNEKAFHKIQSPQENNQILNQRKNSTKRDFLQTQQDTFIITQQISPNIGDTYRPFANNNDISNPNERRSGSVIQNQNESLRDEKVLNKTAPFCINVKKYDDEAQEQQIKEEEENESYIDEKIDKNQKQFPSKSEKRYQCQQNQDDIEEYNNSNTIQSKSLDTSQNKESIQSQQQSIQNCLVCFDEQPDSIFNPCGHGGLCHKCAIDLMRKTGECLLCRIKVEEVLKIDLESKNLGIMKILTSTKFKKVREKIEITEQELQYYISLQRNRIQQNGQRNFIPLPPLPQHATPIQNVLQQASSSPNEHNQYQEAHSLNLNENRNRLDQIQHRSLNNVNGQQQHK